MLLCHEERIILKDYYVPVGSAAPIGVVVVAWVSAREVVACLTPGVQLSWLASVLTSSPSGVAWSDPSSATEVVWVTSHLTGTVDAAAAAAASTVGLVALEQKEKLRNALQKWLM